MILKNTPSKTPIRDLTLRVESLDLPDNYIINASQQQQFRSIHF